MPFKFRLEPILDLRQKREEMLQLELAVLQRELAAADRQRLAFEAQHDGQMATIRTHQTGGRIDFVFLRQGFTYLEALADAIVEQRQVMVEINGRVEAKREEVVRAMQERKALEKLKDRARALYHARVAGAEAAVLEDATTAQYHRLRRAYSSVPGDLNFRRDAAAQRGSMARHAKVDN